MADPIPPKPSVDWMKTVVVPLLSAIAALFAGLHYGGPYPAPQPSPSPPFVQPQPAPIPNPIPLPTSVKVLDTRGMPISGLVEEGRQFTVTSTGATTLFAVPDPDADVTPVTKQQLICTLRNGATLQVMVLVDGANPTLLKIQSNKGAQPLPAPFVAPQPSPQPAPAQKRLLSMNVIEDPLHRTPATVSILNNVAIWNKYIAQGHVFRAYAAMSDPKDATKITTASTEPKGIKAVNFANEKKVALPALVLSDLVTGEPITAVPLPSNDMLDSVISANGG